MDRHQFYTPVRLATFVVGLSIALTIALIPMEPAETLPQVGETALDDVRAREDVAFESAVLTDLARDAAGEDVAAFVTVDRGVERAQAGALQALLTSISDIRGSSATEAERTAALAAMKPPRCSRNRSRRTSSRAISRRFVPKSPITSIPISPRPCVRLSSNWSRR